MNRRNSLLNSSSDEPLTSANTTSAQELVVTDFGPSAAAEDYDATAAALSRLSVMTEQGTPQGGVSPQLNRDSTYETTIISPCPSPSKRTSEYFERPLDESNLKRLRRETMQNSAYLEVSCTYGQDFAVSPSTCTGETQESIKGLGFEALQIASPTPSTSFSQFPDDCASPPIPSPSPGSQCESRISMAASKKPLPRCRSLSAPIYPSLKWLEIPGTKRHRRKPMASHKCLNSLEPLLRRTKGREPACIPLPPITQQTLKELELTEIFKNAQLRHDVVHDPNLQFRPNTDGERGAKKRVEANRYWQSIVQELDDVQKMPAAALAHTRLSLMFQEMKHILLSLVPASEKSLVESSFDHVLFMQTLNHGIFSPTVFAQYMSSLMKRHCAPMRDDVIDGTVAKIEHAKTSLHFAQALRATFDVLETMKLDVANHQLRTLRGYLLDTSVEFERNWFNRKFDSGVYAKEPVIKWYNRQSAKVQGESVDHRKIFIGGFMSFFEDQAIRQLPATFSFDQGRISAMHKDLCEATCLNIVLLLSKQMNKDLKDDDIVLLKAEIWALLATERPSGLDKWKASIAHIALHIAAKSLKPSVAMVLPKSADVEFAKSWLNSHLSQDSPIFKMIHTRLLTLLDTLLYDDLTAPMLNGQKQLSQPSWGILEVARVEITGIAVRASALVSYHWKVHGTNYVHWAQ